MSSIYVIVEGQTERIFVQKVLVPYFAAKGIYLYPILVSKKGQRGGDVRFEKVALDVRNQLSQQAGAYVTTFVDYYGLKEWPRLETITSSGMDSEQIADALNQAARDELTRKHPDLDLRRFIPFVTIHEFEALLFSDCQILARHLRIRARDVEAVVQACGGPENVNNSRETAPSKRLKKWSQRSFKKTVMGIEIAKEIGLSRIRERCPIFDRWISNLEDCAKPY